MEISSFLLILYSIQIDFFLCFFNKYQGSPIEFLFLTFMGTFERGIFFSVFMNGISDRDSPIVFFFLNPLTTPLTHSLSLLKL